MSEPLCPQCGVNAPRLPPTPFNTRTICEPCRVTNERANWRKQAARRSQAHPQGDMCPRCREQPPRRPWCGRGRVAECVACWRLNRKAHSLAVSRRRSVRQAEGRACLFRASHDDIPAAEIDRRFALALKQIRSRAWTSIQRS